MTDIVSEINRILKEYIEGNKKVSYLKLKQISKNYPSNEKLKFNLAFMEQDQGKLEKAKMSYIDLINDFDNFNAKINLYGIFLKEKNYLKALDLINHILKKNNELINVWIDKAYINYKIAKYKTSIEICNSILKKNEHNTKALNLIGLCFFKEKKYKEALEILSKGLEVNRLDLSLLNSIGEVYYELRDLKKSEKFYLKALKIQPDSYQTLNNLAGFYLETNNSKKALKLYEEALRIFPDEHTILENISKTYLSLNENKLAKKFIKKIINITNSASAHKLLSFVYLREENFTKAWKHFDSRLQEDSFIYRNHSYNLIKDKLLKKKQIDPRKQLLIIREQGVGDELLYGTMYKDVLENFKNAYIEADERLIDLFVSSFGNSYLKNFKKFGFFSKNKKKMENIDQVLYAGSLGYYFRNQINDFPDSGYVKIDQILIDRTKEQLSGFKKKFKIGISWKSFNNEYAEQKSLSLDNLLYLLKLSDVDFFNLQYGDVLKEIEEFNYNNNVNLVNLSDIDLFNDFLKVASLLKNLNLLITVSNSTAHLAGALGVKTLLIKPFNQATFFYWDQKTNKTPWYRSIELVEENIINNKKLFSELVYSKLE